MTDELLWRKSSFSGSQANCVEVADAGHVLIRDTKDRDGGTLSFSAEAWQEFIGALR
jgi:hypothetical protein